MATSSPKWRTTSPTICSTSNGSEPPLVSHSTRVERAVDCRGLEHAQRELGVALVAVEEVLGVEHHAESVAAEELDRVGDHRHALVERGAERLGDVVVPRLADDAHR